MKLNGERQAGNAFAFERDPPRIEALEPTAEMGKAVVWADARSISGLFASSVLLAVCLVYFLASVSIGWRNTISDAHGFRQSQTAISADVILRGGPWLIYETPVLGPPWTIPFEFPLYQWIVAALTWLTGSAMDSIGRAVSVAFLPTDAVADGAASRCASYLPTLPACYPCTCGLQPILYLLVTDVFNRVDCAVPGHVVPGMQCLGNPPAIAGAANEFGGCQ